MKKKSNKKVTSKPLSKKILVIVLILIIIAFIIYFSFPLMYENLFKIPEVLEVGTKLHSNITELYSLFTLSMESYVDYPLNVIGCQPNGYYYDDSAVCFLCNDIDACFGFVWTDRAGGKKMNPLGKPYLKDVKNLTTKIADFYKDSLASELNCDQENNTALKCNLDVDFILVEEDVYMIIDDKNKFYDVAEVICKKLENTSAEHKEDFFACGKRIIYLLENKIYYRHSFPVS